MIHLDEVEQNYLLDGDTYLDYLVEEGWIEKEFDNYVKKSGPVWNINSNHIESEIIKHQNKESRTYNDNEIYVAADPYHNYLYKRSELGKNWKPLPDIKVFKKVGDDIILDHYEEVKTKVDCTEKTFNNWVNETQEIYYSKGSYKYDHKDFNTTKMYLVKADSETSSCTVVVISTRTGAELDEFEIKCSKPIYPTKQYVKKNLSNKGSHRWK